ncbi:hypothetical protein FJO69_00605 [[Mycoplasma] falconis]|uniref:Uncharacterized protein n=1 Tax=[Mycoplasma] falconis TaxID=92403 RepID=A0A501XCT2_9BACT|nr:hypothetical protein [[Mycoplasma] falconis]TPE58094.1 hypothetical protein FJO69_00605 [[Mycoplasma] falconis]
MHKNKKLQILFGSLVGITTISSTAIVVSCENEQEKKYQEATLLKQKVSDLAADLQTKNLKDEDKTTVEAKVQEINQVTFDTNTSVDKLKEAINKLSEIQATLQSIEPLPNPQPNPNPDPQPKPEPQPVVDEPKEKTDYSAEIAEVNKQIEAQVKSIDENLALINDTNSYTKELIQKTKNKKLDNFNDLKTQTDKASLDKLELILKSLTEYNKDKISLIKQQLQNLEEIKKLTVKENFTVIPEKARKLSEKDTTLNYFYKSRAFVYKPKGKFIQDPEMDEYKVFTLNEELDKKLQELNVAYASAENPLYFKNNKLKGSGNIISFTLEDNKLTVKFKIISFNFATPIFLDEDFVFEFDLPAAEPAAPAENA